MDIRSVRKSKKFSQDKLAEAIGVNRATLSKYETGAISPTIGMLIKIADALDVPLMAFFDKDDFSEAFTKDLFADPEDLEFLTTLGYDRHQLLDKLQDVENSLIDKRRKAELDMQKMTDNRISELQHKENEAINIRIEEFVNSPIGKSIIYVFYELNSLGQSEAEKRMYELAEIPKYQREK